MKTNHLILMIVALMFGAATIAFTVNTSQHVEHRIDPLPQLIQKDTSAGLITFKSALQNPFFMSQTQEINSYYEINAGLFTNTTSERVPLNLSIVIDRSGSMSGEKIAYVLKAVEFVIDNLSSQDQISLVIYDDQIDVLQETVAVKNKAAIKRKLTKVFSRGGTNLSGGMSKGFEQVKNHYKEGYVNRVLLLTDGLANQGITEPALINNIADNMNKEFGITLSTFGVGLDFNEDLLMDLSEAGSGNFYFIGDPDKIPEIFQQELSGLLNVVAQNAVLRVTLPQGLKLKKSFGYNAVMEGSDIVVNLRDIVSEETKSILLEFQRVDESNSYEIVGVLTFLDAEKGEMVNLKSVNKAMLTEDVSLYESSMDSSISAQVILYKSNELMTETLKAIDKGDYEVADSLSKINKSLLGSSVELRGYSIELSRQDSIVNSYDSTTVQPLNNGEMIDGIQIKATQKSMKSSNYMIKKKR